MVYLLYLIIFAFGIMMLFTNAWIGILIIVISSIFLAVYNNIEKSNNAKNEIERFNSLSLEEKKKEMLNNEIDYTIIVSEDNRKSVGSTVTRGAIGGALLGPIGLVGGALSGKNKTKTTFTIVYKSGRREVVTVENDSKEFTKYAEYVR